MQLSLGMLSDMLSEFQKYLSDRIPKPIYYALGLVVVSLGAIVGYIVGWSTLTDAWNRFDNFYKVVLAVAAAIVFFILAYVLGSLQGAVERWFQGDLPLRLGEILGHQHQAIWERRKPVFQEMRELQSQLYSALEGMKQWGLPQDSGPSVTKHALPRYHMITADDLDITRIDSLPSGALMRGEAVGRMVLHPLDEGIQITGADVICLPVDLKDAAIVAISVIAERVPIGLVPGDMVVIYTSAHNKQGTTRLNASIVVDVQQMYREGANGAKIDLILLTLAVSPSDINTFMKLPDENVLRVVRPASQPASTVTVNTVASQATAQVTNVTVPRPFSTEDMAHVIEKISTLDQQYADAEKWLKGLRTGSLTSFDVNSSPSTIDETFKLLSRPSTAAGTSTADQEKMTTWRAEINDYRNKWMRFLEDALKEIEYRIDQDQRTFSIYYPSSLEKVAPTSIGNVFRAVDSYCDALYGLDSVLVLPRLQVVLEQSTRDQLNKAHEQLALLEWLYLASITIGLGGVFLTFVTHHYFFALILWLLTLPMPQFILYPAILMAALDYAAALRLAFDRERGKVISMMGFSLPSSLNQEQERAIWKQIQQWWVYGTLPEPGNYTLITRTGGATSEKST